MIKNIMLVVLLSLVAYLGTVVSKGNNCSYNVTKDANGNTIVTTGHQWPWESNSMNVSGNGNTVMSGVKNSIISR